MKVFAEHLDLPMYWTIDDDIRSFTEYTTWGAETNCTMGRALYFCQLVMLHETTNLGSAESTETELLEKFTDLLFDSYQKAKDGGNTNLSKFFRAAASKGDAVKRQMFVSLDLQARILELGDDDITEDFLNLTSSLRRVGQVALVHSSNATRYTSFENIVIDGNISHQMDHCMYQCILNNSAALSGIEYMPPEEFFEIPSPEKVAEYKANSRVNQKGAKRDELARAGYRHSDWRFGRQTLEEYNRASYGVIRFKASTCKFPSLVNQDVRHVYHGQEVRLEDKGLFPTSIITVKPIEEPDEVAEEE
uniref:Uncharacterized protein n=1 Tax=Palpitomonas bilix TaxID=652834 RepID=A0A7S3DK77_9EUKA